MKIGLALLGVILVGFTAGALGAFSVNALKGDNERVKEFYLTENAVHVSPHTLRTRMDKGDSRFVLVDLRTSEEYNSEHVVGAVSIPGGQEKDKVLEAFKKLPEGKEIIAYCYSSSCMLARKIGLMLSENGIFVKDLEIGWNEWRFGWKSWNSQGEWNSTKAEDYVTKGALPGSLASAANSSICSKGEFGC